MDPWLPRQKQIVDHYQRLAGCDGPLVTSASGTIIVMHGQFPAFEGEGPGSPYATLGMCTAGGGPTRKFGKGFSVNDIWAPGKLGLALPNEPASGITPPMSMLGIAFNLEDVPPCHGEPFDQDLLRRIGNRLFDDPLAAWMMTSLWNDAEAHGASSAFFDHGLSLLLHRLATLVQTGARGTGMVGDARMADVFAMIEDNLDSDLRVKDLAPLVRLDSRSFTRLFRRETGYAPFGYLTFRRMERAKSLLDEGQMVTDVATAVGYSNPAKFAAAFRRWVGCAPSQWRARGMPRGQA